MRKIHADHIVPLSGSAKQLCVGRLRLGVTSGVGAAMARKSSCAWSDEVTFVLIEIWGKTAFKLHVCLTEHGEI